MNEAKSAIDMIVTVIDWNIVGSISLRDVLVAVMVFNLAVALWRYAAEKVGY